MIKSKYIKSFSKGQITVPKEIRDELELGDIFWLKIYLDQNRIVGEVVDKGVNKNNYSKRLLKRDGGWFDTGDWKEVRKGVKKRLQKYDG